MGYDLVVIGAGAAGVFATLAAKEAHPHARVLLLEKTAVPLAKVRVSGGGRCNVTHACFDPRQLVLNYPRGSKELLGPFHRFQPRDTMAWFAARGVQLKTEEDGRVFPASDQSATIVQCLLTEAERIGVEIRLKQRVSSISKDGLFTIALQDGSVVQAERLLLATGSSPDGYAWATSLGHSIQKPVPSLFTFNVPTSPLLPFSGVVVEDAELAIDGSRFSQRGPLLLTHFGFSGPAALKLSAWAARFLHEHGYRAGVRINWLPRYSQEALVEELLQCKATTPHKSLAAENPFRLPKGLWRHFAPAIPLVDTPNKALHALAQQLHSDVYQLDGKTTNKEEFVTCGGIPLKEVDFKTMQSKLCPGLFFAGEVLDIDGVTGGFNFQSAWTTGYIAGTQ